MKLIKILTILLLTINLQAQKPICSSLEIMIPNSIVTKYNMGCVLGYKEIHSDTVTLPLSKTTVLQTEKKLTVHGKVRDIIFGNNDQKETSVLEVKKKYEKVLQRDGFEIIFSANDQKELSEFRNISDAYPSFGSEEFMETLTHVNLPKFKFAFASHDSSQDNEAAFFVATYKKESIKYTIAVNIRHNKTMLKELSDNIFIHVKIIKSEVTKVIPFSVTSIQENIEKNGKEVLYDIHFDISNKLSSESYTTIETLAEYLNNNKDKRFYIVAHTNNAGSLVTNKTISEKRAKAIFAALITKYNVDSYQISAHGVGQLAPIGTNTNRLLNKRIEIVLR